MTNDGNTHHENIHPEGADNHGNGHKAHHGNARRQGAMIVAILAGIFLCSVAAHFLFAREMIYDWSQSRRNAGASAVQQLQPSGGTPENQTP